MTLKLLGPVKMLSLVGLAISVAVVLIETRGWPVTGDAALMHYVAFAIRKGEVPYKTLQEINLPLAYVPDWVAIRLFGMSDLAWRLYDYALLFVIAASLFLWVPAGSKLSSLWTSGLFILAHARDGIEQSAQRDLTGAALVLLGIVAYSRLSREKTIYAGISLGIFIGSAALVKPPLALFLAAVLLSPQRRTWEGLAKRLLAAVAGFGVPVSLCLFFLARSSSLSSFLFCMRVLASFHAGLRQPSLSFLIQNSLSPFLTLLVLWLCAFLLDLRDKEKGQQARNDFENKLLWLCMMAGVCSYFFQGKAFPYQRYPFLIFFLLWLSHRFWSSISKPSLSAYPSAIALLWAGLIFAPSSAYKASHYDWQHRQFVTALQSDLTQLAGSNPESLSRHVLCIDSVSGCVETLYRLRLLNASAVMYDEFLFSTKPAEAVFDSQRRLGEDVRILPQVVVVSASSFPFGPANYEKLRLWTNFSTWLNRNYVLQEDRSSEMPVHTVGRPFTPPGYRLYVLRPGVSVQALIPPGTMTHSGMVPPALDRGPEVEFHP